MAAMDQDIRAAVVKLLDALTAMDVTDHPGSVQALPTVLATFPGHGSPEQEAVVLGAITLATSMTTYIATMKQVDRLAVISAFRDMYE